MTDRLGPHARTYVHPLFPLLTAPPVYALRRALALESVIAVRVMIAAAAALWLPTMFLILRLLRLPRLDAILFSLIAASSSASVFCVPGRSAVGTPEVPLS